MADRLPAGTGASGPIPVSASLEKGELTEPEQSEALEAKAARAGTAPPAAALPPEPHTFVRSVTSDTATAYHHAESPDPMPICPRLNKVG